MMYKAKVLVAYTLDLADDDGWRGTRKRPMEHEEVEIDSTFVDQMFNEDACHPETGVIKPKFIEEHLGDKLVSPGQMGVRNIQLAVFWIEGESVAKRIARVRETKHAPRKRQRGYTRGGSSDSE